MDRGISNPVLEYASIAFLVLAISTAHYLTPPELPLLHDIYRRLYYVPIVWSAIRFGLKWGLVVSVVVSIVFLPHIFHRWGTIALMTTDALFEILLYNSIAAVTGLLANSERYHRDRLEEANLALVRSDQMKQLGEIAAGMAHEIRNPLASLQGGIEILGKDTTAPEERSEVSNLLLTEMDRIEKTIRDFLQYARPETILVRDIDVREVVTEVHSLLERSSKDNTEFKLIIDPDVPTIKADLSQIRSVVMNLALNASTAAGGKGSVEMCVRRDGGDVFISVSDNGEGVKPDSEGRIFEPFYTTRKDGTGLGLSIVKRIVETHGGTIVYFSKPGVGTTFEVRLKGEKS